VISLRTLCTGLAPVHFFHKLGRLAAAAALAAVPVCVASANPAPAPPASVAAPVGQTVADFYKARNGAPLWLSPSAGNAAQQLISLLSTVGLDGFDPGKYQLSELQSALAAASKGKRKYVDRADEELSEAFVAYVRDLKQDPGVGITYVDAQLRPAPPSPLAALLEAAAAPSLSDYLRTMGWMHPFYAQLREALANHAYANDTERQRLTLNLERARVLPAG
jgi:L,D-transpeptidase YcbB